MTDHMQTAITQAKEAASRDEVPVGAVLINTKTGEVIAVASNRCEELNDPSAHAEMLVLREACTAQKTTRLPDYDLYVTLEPCAMCAAMISNTRIRRLYYGAYDPKSGGVEHGAKVFDHTTTHHKPEIYGGIMEAECATLMTDFFKSKR